MTYVPDPSGKLDFDPVKSPYVSVGPRLLRWPLSAGRARIGETTMAAASREGMQYIVDEDRIWSAYDE